MCCVSQLRKSPDPGMLWLSGLPQGTGLGSGVTLQFQPVQSKQGHPGLFFSQQGSSQLSSTTLTDCGTLPPPPSDLVG